MHKKLYPTNKKKQNNKCPNCGLEFHRHSTFESVLAGQFDNPGDGAWSVNSFTPTRKADFVSDVCVPAAQAFISALLVVPPISSVLRSFGYDWYLSFPLSALVLGAYWFRGVRQLEKERGVSQEFNYDPSPSETPAGLAPAKKENVQLEMISKDDDFKASMKIIDLPSGMTGAEFVQFARDILAGKPLARTDWVGDGKQFSRDIYDGLMSAMMAAGLIIPVAGKGKKLTPGGRRAISRMIRMT